jgi:hypothetical protein
MPTVVRIHKKNLALGGLAIIGIGIALGIYFPLLEKLAIQKDHVSRNPGFQNLDCHEPLREVHISRRIMPENESQALTVDLANDSDEDCTADLVLLAPNFDISPNEDSREITLPAHGKAQVVLIFCTRKARAF